MMFYKSFNFNLFFMRNICLRKSIRFLSLFLFVPLWLGAQNITVTGKVTDKSGEGLIGVNVTEKGTNNGIATDVDGNYSLSVSRDATLDFRYVGYVSQSLPVQGKSMVSVVLSEDTKALEEVVVIGYGTQRREAVTGSVASIGGNAMRDVPAGDITNALQGRVAGVNMSQTSTKPGSTMQIRIRGTRSINATNDPLVVLDGIPFAGTISDISPDDIKSVDILKDASATAIYGSRGANGVIMVTTYSGNKNQAAQITYSGYYGWKDAIKLPLMNGADFAALRARAGIVPGPGTDEPVDANGNYTANTDWQNLFLKTGIVTNHDLSVMGGNEKGSYKFGVGFYDDQAVVPQQWYKRFSLRGSLDQKIGIFRLGFTTNNNFNITNGTNRMGINDVVHTPPLVNPYNADGTLKTRVLAGMNDIYYVRTRSTVDALGDLFADRTNAFGSYNSLYAELSIPGVEGLKARVNLGGNYRQSNGGTYIGEGVFSSTITNPSVADINNSLTYNWTDENLLTYDRTFAEKHNLNLVGMYSCEQTFYNKSDISRKNIAADAFQYFNLGQSSTSSNDDITIDPSPTGPNHLNGQDYQLSGLMSWMGRVMYSFDNRYMISATIRSDGSSRLAPGHKWHTYPAISAGWNINKESFMQNVSWIDALKLRLGWGQTSNQSVDPYSTLGLLSTIPYNFGPKGYATGYSVSQLPNTNLGWEYSITTNAGLDFTLLKKRLSGTFEYYVTNTHDLLLSVNLPPTSGVSSYMANVGSTQNKGWELTLNGTIVKTKDWQWDAGVNFAGNKNKITALNSGRTQDVDNWLFVGHPINVIYDYKRTGIWQESEADQVKLYEGAGAMPGMIKVLYTGEYNDDGTPKRIIGPDDKQILDADPNWTGGFNTRVSYKGIDLTLLGSFQNGGILNSMLYGSNGYLNTESGRWSQVKIDYWTQDTPNAYFPDPNGPKDSNNPRYGSTLGYFSGTYLKIGTATLGYNFDPKSLQKAGIQRLRVYFTVQNPLILFSPYHNQSGMDPETNALANDPSVMNVPMSSNLKRLLVVGFNTPSTHNYMIGLNVTF